METANLRLLIIANDPLARTGLAALVENQANILVVGYIAGDEDLTSAIDIYRPDVLLCDLGWSPEPVIRQLAGLELAEIPTVILLSDTADVDQALDSGARGVLLRDTDGNRLAAALWAVAEGLVILDPAFSKTFWPNSQPIPPLLAEPLTPRELEVLQLLAQGLPNKSIARHLDISEHTIKFHVNAIMSKLNAQSRTEAVVRATQLGLILL